MADLPMNLLVIGPDTSQQIDGLASSVGRAGPRGGRTASRCTDPLQRRQLALRTPVADPIDAVIRDGRALVIHNFERLPDKEETAAKAHAALTRILSALGNSVIIVSSLDPVQMTSIEASERWRTVLRSFVRIDLHSTPRQRRGRRRRRLPEPHLGQFVLPLAVCRAADATRSSSCFSWRRKKSSTRTATKSCTNCWSRA